jgi:hypothetical protein
MTERYSASSSAKPRPFPSRRPNDNENSGLVNVILTPYGEATKYYIAWEVQPKDSAHAILRVELFVEPERGNMMDFRVIAQHVSTASGVPKVPAGVMLRGESGHIDIPPGTKVKIQIWGDIQISDQDVESYSYCRTVISGEDILRPC